MKQSLANLLRALAVLLLFVPTPLSITSPTAAVAEPLVVAAEPAVILPEAAEEETEDPWTSRFLAPAVVVISVVAVGASISYYVVRVRGRYRAV